MVEMTSMLKRSSSARGRNPARPRGGDLVIDGVGRLGARHQIDPEDLDELVLQPVTRGGAAEELPVLAERTPDLPGVGLDRAAVDPRHAESSGSIPCEASMRNT